MGKRISDFLNIDLVIVYKAKTVYYQF